MTPAWSVAVAVSLCVLSAVAYASGALLQQQAAQAPALLRSPRWWLGMSANGVGALLHVVALRYGSLTLVQALGALTLVAAVPLAAVVARRRVTRAELAGTALTTGALVALLAFAGSSGQALTMRGCIAVTLGAAAVMAWAAVHPRLPALGAAAVGGMGFGVASALTQTLTVRLDSGVPTLVAGMAAVVALNVAAVWFTQRSYRVGLAAPLAVGTVANPVTAALIGVTLLHQRFQGGAAGIFVVVACALALTVGVFLLAQAQAGPAFSTAEPQTQPRRASSSPRRFRAARSVPQLFRAFRSRPAVAFGGLFRLAVAFGGPFRPAVASGRRFRPAVAFGGLFRLAVAFGGPFRLAVASGGPFRPAVASGGPFRPAVVPDGRFRFAAVPGGRGSPVSAGPVRPAA